MPRDSSGTYTLPAGNPVAVGATIEAAWANSTAGDIATELTNSLDRNGRGGMLAPFQFADGSLANPSLTFVSDNDTGFYRDGSGSVIFSSNNTNAVRLGDGTEGLQVYRDAGWQGVVDKTTNQTIAGSITFSSAALFNGGLTADGDITLTSGDTLRIANNEYIAWRNAANSAWVNCINMSSSDICQLGPTGANTNIRASSRIRMADPTEFAERATFDNNKILAWDNAAGTRVDFCKMDASDDFNVGTATNDIFFEASSYEFRTGSLRVVNGTFQMPNNTFAQFRNQADSGWVNCLRLATDNRFEVGPTAYDTVLKGSSNVVVDGVNLVIEGGNLRLDNTQDVLLEDSGGTAREVLSATASNNLRVGEATFKTQIRGSSIDLQTDVEGAILTNQEWLQGRAAGGTALNLMRVDAFDNISIGNAGSDHYMLSQEFFKLTAAASYKKVPHYWEYDNTRQDTSFTLVAADEGRVICIAGDPTTMSTGRTVTIPPNSSVAFPVGTEINIVKLDGSLSSLTIATGAGVTLIGDSAVASLSYVSVKLIKIDTDKWLSMMYDINQ